MDISKRYVTSEAAEIEGIWRNLEEAGEVRVARLGNTRYQQAYQRLERNKGTVDGTVLTEAEQTELVVEAMAEAVLVDWRGIEWEGEPMPYSLENAKVVLRVKDFRRVVLELSRDWEQYRKARLETAAKN